jgi:ferredoxin-NADP reductase
MPEADPEDGAGGVGFCPARIAALAHETTSVLELELEACDGAALSLPLPGQYVMLRMKPAPDAPHIVRSFSLCGPATTARYRLGIKSHPGGTASRILETAGVGDVLDLSSPQGSFVLKPGDGPIALVSAGIGITPVLAMLYALAAEASQREVWWLYGARNRAEHPFADDVRTLLATLPHGHAHTCYSRPGADDVVGRDFDSVGHVDAALIERLGVPAEAEFYLCGPGEFLDDGRAGLRSRGVSECRIHSEIFVAASSPASRQVTAPPVGPVSESLVSFARSGRAVRWNAAERTLLELAEQHDIDVPWLCRMGVCHTCETRLLSGSVAYRPVPPQAPADGNVLLCCSQPVADVVLDR